MAELAGKTLEEVRVASVIYSVRLTGEDIEKLLCELFQEQIRKAMPEGSVLGRVRQSTCGTIFAIVLTCEVAEG